MTANIRIHEENNRIKVLINPVLEFALWVSRMPWFWGLIPVVFFGLFFTAKAYYPIRRLRKKTNKLLRDIKALSDSFPQREAADIHASIEDMIIDLDSIDTTLHGYYVLKPLTTEIKRIRSLYKEIEYSTFNLAYPDYHEPLTKEEEEQIITTFKSWNEDWADEKLNVYNDLK